MLSPFFLTIRGEDHSGLQEGGEQKELGKEVWDSIAVEVADGMFGMVGMMSGSSTHQATALAGR